MPFPKTSAVNKRSNREDVLTRVGATSVRYLRMRSSSFSGVCDSPSKVGRHPTSPVITLLPLSLSLRLSIRSKLWSPIPFDLRAQARSKGVEGWARAFSVPSDVPRFDSFIRAKIIYSAKRIPDGLQLRTSICLRLSTVTDFCLLPCTGHRPETHGSWATLSLHLTQVLRILPVEQ